MLLTPHFSLEEMVYSDTARERGIDNTASPDIIENLTKTAAMLERVRLLTGGPLIVTSGYRSIGLNQAVGDVPNSAHLTGQAADFHCPGYIDGNVIELCRLIAGYSISLNFDQCIYENNLWCHLAWSDTPRRQLLIIDHTGQRFVDSF